MTDFSPASPPFSLAPQLRTTQCSRFCALSLPAVVALLTVSFLPAAQAQNAQAQNAVSMPISSTRNDAPAPVSANAKSSSAKPTALTAVATPVATPTATPTSVLSATAPTIAAPSPSTAATNVIAINVNGRIVATDPAPVLQNGSVLVPLRGVLENLGATVGFNAQTRGILVSQGTRRVVLLLDSRQATVDGKIVSLAAAPQLIGSSAFVPLRSLAQLFGYEVEWIPATTTVAIRNASGAVLPNSNHRQALRLSGHLGIGISLVEGEAAVSDAEAERLLDAAKDAGASLIKVRFDWGVLEPKRGAAVSAWAFLRQRRFWVRGVAA